MEQKQKSRRLGRKSKSSGMALVIAGILLLLAGIGLTTRNIIRYQDWVSVEATYDKANCIMTVREKPKDDQSVYARVRRGRSGSNRVVCDRMAHYQFEGKDYETLEKRYFDGWTIWGLKPGTRWVNPSNPAESIAPVSEFKYGVILTVAGAGVLWLGI